MDSFYELINNGTPIVRALAARATIDFASIAAGGTNTATITVPGASVGDPVALGLPASVAASIVFSAHVTADNTVTVRAFNPTAGAIDPASATYKVVVFKL